MLRRSVRIQSQIKPKRKVLVIKSIRGLANLYLDKSWKRGCETINLTGKRQGKLCNCKYFSQKNGRKICRKHCEEFIDVAQELSVIEEEDDCETDDENFIADEDDGTKLINGKVLVPQDQEYNSEEDEDYVDEETRGETSFDDEYYDFDETVSSISENPSVSDVKIVKHVYPSGYVYEGDWVNGKREGTGKITFSGGDVYEGDWVDDKVEGKGKYTYLRGGIVYEGDWVNGKREGNSKITYLNGDSMESVWSRDISGLWKQGKPCGKVKCVYANGDYYIGDFENNPMIDPVLGVRR